MAKVDHEGVYDLRTETGRFRSLNLNNHPVTRVRNTPSLSPVEVEQPEYRNTQGGAGPKVHLERGRTRDVIRCS